MSHVTLNQALKRVEIKNVEIENKFVFEYFDSLPSEERDEKLKQAIQIGVLALEENRISAFLAKTKNELGTELECLKIRFDMKAELFSKSSAKGAEAEEDIAEYLTELNKKEGNNDLVELTRNSPGAIRRNKTGDILCYIDGSDEKRVVIECKFEKNMKFGPIEEQDWYGSKLDSALGQLIEAQANRECSHALIVFDLSSINPALLKRVKNISYRAPYGFVVVVDSFRGDYRNLGLAYLVARDLACANPAVDRDGDILTMLLERIIAEASKIAGIRALVERNIGTCHEIISQLDQGVLSLEFCQTHLRKFLSEGTLSNTDLHEFYTGGDRREKYKATQHTIDEVTKGE